MIWEEHAFKTPKVTPADAKTKSSLEVLASTGPRLLHNSSQPKIPIG